MRAVQADTFRGMGLILFTGALVLAGWSLWLVRARIAVYALSQSGRLEIAAEPRPVEAAVEANVVALKVALGQTVHKGEVILQLDDEVPRQQAKAERAHLAELALQLDAAKAELAGDLKARQTANEALTLTEQESRSRLRESEVNSAQADVELQQARALWAKGIISQAELQRIEHQFSQRAAATDATAIAAARAKLERARADQEREALIAHAQGQIAQLESERVQSSARAEQLEHDLALRTLVSPVDGRIGEITSLRPGALVRVGQRVATVVPEGALKMVASFPAEYVGRIRPGQRAALRLDAFPWTQFGTVSAKVASAASETTTRQIRVELALEPSQLPLEHGLTGATEVELERVSPATLVLRAAGLLATSASQPEGNGGLDLR